MKNKTLILTLLLITLTGLTAAQGQYSNLEMEVMHTEPVPLQAGEYADIWIRVTNTGTAEAHNPEFEVVNSFPFNTTGKSQFEVANGGLGTGESRDIRVQLKVSENAVFGNNSLKIRKSSDGEDFIEQEIPLEVRVDDRSLIVSSLEFPKHVEPGSSAKMTLNLENLANSQFRNIDVSLDTEELPISTRETSRKRIPSLNGHEDAEVSFTIDVDSDAENQLIDLPITIDYQDQAGNELSTTETTGVSIGGTPNIDVAIEDSDIRTPGRGTMTLRIINKGEGEARFTEIDVQESEGFEVLSQDSIYLGSMIADDFQTAEFDLYVDSEDQLELPIKVDYRDGEGDKTEEFTVQRELYTESELEKYGLSGGNSTLPILIVLLVLAGGAAYYWRKKRD